MSTRNYHRFVGGPAGKSVLPTTPSPVRIYTKEEIKAFNEGREIAPQSRPELIPIRSEKKIEAKINKYNQKRKAKRTKQHARNH